MKRLEIVEHRTGWCDDFSTFEDKSLQNTHQGFVNSFARGNGVETDIRDVKGELVISHDMPKGTELTFEEMLKIYNDHNCKGLLALNVKCDGMQKKIKDLLEKYDVTNYFMFDMSVPDTLGYLQLGVRSFVRDSEHEVNPKISSPIIYEGCDGVWLDQFMPGQPSRVTYDLMKKYLDEGKHISIVSPELHPWGRDEKQLYLAAWSEYKKAFDRFSDEEMARISLCTDLPLQAETFFN